MSAVKVVDGYANGSFNPQATLTRGAAAKIICNLILGPTTASALTANQAPYKDVPANHTFAGYIAFCKQQKIISGYADETFRPAATLTSYAFMKMLLGALGYDADVEHYVGTNWSIQVAKRALQIGLDDGLKTNFVGTKPVTREEACLYAMNTLKADMVEYDTTIQIGNVTVAGSKAEVVKNTNVRMDGKIYDVDGVMQFAEKYFSDVRVESVGDDFGRPSNKWTYKNDNVGTYAVTGDLVGTFTEKVTKADVYEKVGKSVADKLTDGKATLTVWFDGVKTSVAKADVENYVEKNNTGEVNGTGNGDLTEIYVDKNGNTTIVTIRTYVFQAAADFNVKKDTISLTTDNTKCDTDIVLTDKLVNVEDYPVIADLKADDYVLVTAVKTRSGRYEVKSLEKAEVVTDDVTGYKYQSNVTMGNETYDYSATAQKVGIKDTTYNVGKPASLILDKYGYVIAVDEAIVLSDYVYISEFGSTSSLNAKALANAVFPDGTTAEIVVKEAYNKKADAQEKTKSVIAGWEDNTDQIGWFTYSKNSNSEYSLYAIEAKYTQDSTTASGSLEVMTNKQVNAMKNVSDLGVKSALFDNETIVVVEDKDDELTVYTGVANIPTLKLDDGGSAKIAVVKKMSNHYASLVYVKLDGKYTISGGKEENLVYVVSYDGKYITTDNEVFYKYTTLKDGVEEKVVADSVINSKLGDVYGVAHYLTKNSKDQLTGFDMVTTTSGTLVAGSDKYDAIAQSAGTLTIGGESFVVTADTKIDLVILKSASVMNRDADADYEVSANITAKQLADTVKGYTCTYDFAGKVDSANESVLTELYVTIKTAVSTISGGSEDLPADLPEKVELAANNTLNVFDRPETGLSVKELATNYLVNSGLTVDNVLSMGTEYKIYTTAKNGITETFTTNTIVVPETVVPAK